MEMSNCNKNNKNRRLNKSNKIDCYNKLNRNYYIFLPLPFALLMVDRSPFLSGSANSMSRFIYWYGGQFQRRKSYKKKRKEKLTANTQNAYRLR